MAYELVLLEKPDTLENYVVADRAGYDACVSVAKLLHAATKPFPQLPPTLGYRRTIYLISGRDYVVRHERVAELDKSKMKPDQGCEATVSTDKGLDVSIGFGAVETSIGLDDTGHRIVQTSERLADSTSRPTAQYTEARTVNGIALRCLPQGNPALDPVLLQEVCVYARDGILLEPNGNAIVLASRIKPTPSWPWVTIKEPESLRTLQHPDASLFNPATYR
jgi:hypothetical protein